MQGHYHETLHPTPSLQTIPSFCAPAISLLCPMTQPRISCLQGPPASAAKNFHQHQRSTRRADNIDEDLSQTDNPPRQQRFANTCSQVLQPTARAHVQYATLGGASRRSPEAQWPLATLAVLSCHVISIRDAKAPRRRTAYLCGSTSLGGLVS